jgi:hypothetical protein
VARREGQLEKIVRDLEAFMVVRVPRLGLRRRFLRAL